MKKIVTVAALFLITFPQVTISQESTISYPEYEIEEYRKYAQSEVSKAFYKKVAFLAAAAGFFYYRTYSQSERFILAPRTPDVTWVDFGITNLKKLQELFAEILLQQIMIACFSPQKIVTTFLVKMDLQYFYTHKTRVSVISESLIQESSMLHLITTKDDACYKMDLIRDQAHMLFYENIKVLGFMYYEYTKRQESFIASGMLRIIEKQQKKMEQLTQDLSFYSAYYIDQFDDEQKRMKAASSFSVALTAYIEEFEADYKAFLLYLKGA